MRSVSGEYDALVAIGAVVYIGLAVLTALNSLMEGRSPVGFRDLAVVAMVSLFWPLAVLAVALALVWRGPAAAAGKGKS
jgi:hypothetical protein